MTDTHRPPWATEIAMNARWTFGNALLAKTEGAGRRIACFAIPADHDFTHAGTSKNTCPGAQACAGVCYAKQGRYMMPTVAGVRQHNLELSMRPDFIELVTADLHGLTGPRRRKPVNVVRLHDSGDFYDQRYLDDWCDIASAFPRVELYAYTKSHHLDFSRAPANLRIIQSMGGKFDHLIDLGRQHSRIFTSHEDREREGYVDGLVGDGPALDGLVKLGQVYHGSRGMTDAQKKYFR
jgi:hypothetical protein